MKNATKNMLNEWMINNIDKNYYKNWQELLMTICLYILTKLG